MNCMRLRCLWSKQIKSLTEALAWETKRRESVERLAVDASNVGVNWKPNWPRARRRRKRCSGKWRLPAVQNEGRSWKPT